VLPPTLVSQIEIHLSLFGSRPKIISAETVGGGCIHNTVKLKTSAGLFFLKWNASSQPGMFSGEADGLARISATDTVRVPQVHFYGDRKLDDTPGFILLEWIEPSSKYSDPAVLGEKLAELHRTKSRNNAYGLDINNFIGILPQQNSWSEDWVAFFRDRRLSFQMNLAIQKGNFQISRQKKLEIILGRLENYLGGVMRQPALLHGDLWAGNVISGPGAEPYLIDPAVYYGDREAELSYTELFGGFSPRFYQAYHTTWPLEPGYTERRDLYNLYHLLNHLNIFGESYGLQIDAILKTYSGH
jgi:protein-ribulosamine 3-kinase